MKKTIIILMGVLIFSSFKKDLVDTSANSIPDITDLATFNQNIEEGVSLVFFHASWCSKCKEQRPAFESVSQHPERGDAKFYEIEYEDYKEIVDAAGVKGFPTMVLYKNGEETDRFVGTGHSESKLIDAIKANL